ncbi:hypothetical protein [Hymenobacter yonginensis]|uniref:DUF5034 domain-containing protein n=1 Tax=Hymenobacter yonginensis TaxID=748197 RepID=A0ABY7PQ43_9BACT|nr:hypothetical protein [Hymenobacter yonginensis]WBO84931.1 hypothetical protein O9Z63_01500 [Hymenobacter yonginensis]
MKKLLLCALAIIGLPACDICGPFDEQFGDVTGLTMVAVQHRAGTSVQVLTAGQSASVAEFKLLMRLNVRLYSAAPVPTGGFSAMACDYPSPSYEAQVDSITITSRYDFDAQHPAGTSLNSLLRLDDGYASSQRLSDLMKDPQYIPYLQDRNLQFTQAPTSSATQQFRVRYHQTNGEVYTAETVPVTIQP